MKQIDPPKAGDPVSKLWKVVDELVKRVNALSALKCSPESAGRFNVTDSDATLQLNTSDTCPPA
jgi:hypothetical protein